MSTAFFFWKKFVSWENIFSVSIIPNSSKVRLHFGFFEKCLVYFVSILDTAVLQNLFWATTLNKKHMHFHGNFFPSNWSDENRRQFENLQNGEKRGIEGKNRGRKTTLRGSKLRWMCKSASGKFCSFLYLLGIRFPFLRLSNSFFFKNCLVRSKEVNFDFNVGISYFMLTYDFSIWRRIWWFCTKCSAWKDFISWHKNMMKFFIHQFWKGKWENSWS